MDQNSLAQVLALSFFTLIIIYVYYKSSMHNEKKSSLMSLMLILLYGGLIASSVSSCDKSAAEGLYHDDFNNSIELQSNGKVHYYQITGKSMSCHTTGTWTKVDNNQLIISLEINSNCLFNKRYSGTWEIKDCYKLGEAESGCLVKGDEYNFYKVK